MGLDTTELIMEIEDNFNIKIPNKEIHEIFTVQDIYDVVLLHTNKNLETEIKPVINALISEKSGVHVNAIRPTADIVKDLGLS